MSERLEILRPILSQFKRRFSVFSLGSGIECGLEQEIADEFDCVVVCAEKDPLRYVPHGRMIVLRREFSAEDLDLLSKCEHFDVVLAMNVLHWADTKWERCFGALWDLGETIIYQTPLPEDSGACGDWNEKIHERLSSGRLLGTSVQFDGHMPRPIYQFQGSIGFLSTKSFGSRNEISATVTGGIIKLHHKGHIAMDYIPGLTLENFKKLNGVWPPTEMIVSALRLMKWDGAHRDITAWNIRMDSQECYLIDPGGSDWPDSDAENLERVIEWVKA